MSNLKNWIRVEDGSTLEVSVSGDQVSVGSRLLVDTGAEERWLDADLRPGPHRLRLRVPHVYVLRVLVALTGGGKGEIRARVVKPGGKVHGDPWVFSVAGSEGDVRRVTIVAETLKS